MLGILNYIIYFLIIAGIYAILALALNLHWGITGILNFGVVGFFAIGAYTAAIITKSSSVEHLGGYSMPFGFGIIFAAVISGLIAFFLGFVILRFKEDYQAIVTIGISEVIHSFFQNNYTLFNGTRGIKEIPSPLSNIIPYRLYDYFYLFIIVTVVLLLFLFIERATRSPWGRVLKAIRENEEVTGVLGKNTFAFKMQSFILGAAVMGIAGALFASKVTFISPEAFTPMTYTFMVWIMLMVGGRGNNLGVIVGALGIWLLWTGSEFFTNLMPAALKTQTSQIRIIIIGIILEVILLFKPDGILGEEKVNHIMIKHKS